MQSFLTEYAPATTSLGALATPSDGLDGLQLLRVLRPDLIEAGARHVASYGKAHRYDLADGRILVLHDGQGREGALV